LWEVLFCWGVRLGTSSPLPLVGGAVASSTDAGNLIRPFGAPSPSWGRLRRACGHAGASSVSFADSSPVTGEALGAAAAARRRGQDPALHFF